MMENARRIQPGCLSTAATAAPKAAPVSRPGLLGTFLPDRPDTTRPRQTRQDKARPEDKIRQDKGEGQDRVARTRQGEAAQERTDSLDEWRHKENKRPDQIGEDETREHKLQ